VARRHEGEEWLAAKPLNMVTGWNLDKFPAKEQTQAIAVGSLEKIRSVDDIPDAAIDTWLKVPPVRTDMEAGLRPFPATRRESSAISSDNASSCASRCGTPIAGRPRPSWRGTAARCSTASSTAC
jgi:hypothetical protein